MLKSDPLLKFKRSLCLLPLLLLKFVLLVTLHKGPFDLRLVGVWVQFALKLVHHVVHLLGVEHATFVLALLQVVVHFVKNFHGVAIEDLG